MERILLRTAKFEYKVIEPIYEEQAVNTRNTQKKSLHKAFLIC